MAASGPPPMWAQIEESYVAGKAVMASTEPDVDALRQADEAHGLANRIRAITDAEIARHGPKWLPRGSDRATVEALMTDIGRFHDLQGQIVAVPPEALLVPRDDSPDDAAGFQLHVRPGDVLIPVCESGLGLSQVLHAVLTDVAREANRRLVLTQRGKHDCKHFANVTPPHGAVSGFDPYLPVKDGGPAAEAPGAAASASRAEPAGGARKSPPQKSVVEAAYSLSQEAASEEMLSFAHEPAPPAVPVSAMSVALSRQFGRRMMPRCGQSFASGLGIGHRQEDAMHAMGGDAAALTTARRLVAEQRACREFMSAMIYNGDYLRDCALADSAADARAIFFVCGRAVGPVLRRLVEVAGRGTSNGSPGHVLNVVVVALPTWDLEAELPRHVEAAGDPKTIRDPFPTLTPLMAFMSTAYKSFARTIRAKVPAECVETPGALEAFPAEALWTEAAPVE